MIDEGKKKPEDAPQSPEARSMLMLHSGFDDRLNGKLSYGDTEPSMTVDGVCCLLVFDCRQLVFFRKLRTVDKYELVFLLLCTFLTQNLSRPNVFFPKESVPFRRNMMRVYGIAATVNEHDLVTNLASV